MFSRTTEERIRSGLLAILALGLAGTEAELILLKHTEEWWQLVPVILLGVALVVLVWFALSRAPLALRTLEVTMVLFVASGILGTIQHFNANVLDAGESNPSLAGMALYREAMMGSIPALAPGAMVQLGLIGIVFSFRHPALRGSQPRSNDSTT
jgi:hypothetical protein